MKNRIFLPLLLVLSATAFSASVMATSDTKAPSDNSKNASGWPELPQAFIHEPPEWCRNWPHDILKPEYWCQICEC
ncbi:TPA: PagK family vesicle-borne virulence factor [Salmonella enterica subsp. enterica serovar Eastbourne]|nr:hypothetical protein [Salmonella enterica subsp. enterica serovar Thompson]